MGAILLGIIMFMFLVIIHELGHFYAAKKTGVHVKEFGVGIPPKAATLRKDKGNTEYTINWLPLGGFVRLKGEDPDDPEEFMAQDSFITASLSNKIIILLGGVVVNAVFAWLAFAGAFWLGVAPISIIPDSAMKQTSESYLMPSQSHLVSQGLIKESDINAGVLVNRVIASSLAETMGVQSGDIILSMNGQKLTSSSLSAELQKAIGSAFTMSIDRGGDVKEVQGVCPVDSCMFGIAIGGLETGDLLIKMPLGKALIAGLQEVKAQTVLTLSTLKTLGSNLFSGEQKRISSSVDKLSGPVGIVAFGQKLFYQRGRVSFLAFAGMISLALAIFNILPIPALDGGRIVTAIIQEVGKFSPQKYFIRENYVNIFFFVLLMGLGLFVIYQDIIKL